MAKGAVVRGLTGTILASGIVAGLIYGFTPPAVDVDLAVVVRGPLMVSVEDDGRTRVRERYVVSAPLGGRLLRTPLHSGDTVVANETVVATIEASDVTLLDDRARAAAEARLKAAEVHREQTAILIERAQDAEAIARTELNRAEDLHGKGALTADLYDATRLKYRLAAHDLSVAEFNLTIAEFERDQAQAALIHYRERTDSSDPLFRHTIRSPISGRVFRIFEENANPVVVGTRLIELGDPTDLEVEIDVLSVDAVRIRPGTKVWLNHWGGEEPLEARVRTVEPSAFTKVSALGIEEQRVWIIADILTPPEKRMTLGDGFRVEASLVTWEADDVLKVPDGALFRRGNEWSVFVVRNSIAELQTVQTGHSNGLETEILQGLAAGDQVVLHPGERVSPGVTVRVR